MKKPPSPNRRPGAPDVTCVGAARFKATCLELLDRVRASGAALIMTKHGKPVAKVVSCTEAERPVTFIGSMKGTVLRYDRPLDPLDEVWDADQPGDCSAFAPTQA